MAKSKSDLSLSAEQKWLKELLQTVSIPPKDEEFDLHFQKLRKQPGILFSGLFVITGMPPDPEVNNSFYQELNSAFALIFTRLDPLILAKFIDDVTAFGVGLETINQKARKKEMFNINGTRVSITTNAFNLLSIREEEELALLIGKMEQARIIQNTESPDSFQPKGEIGDNGLMVLANHNLNHNQRQTTPDERRILELIAKANSAPALQPPKPALSPQPPTLARSPQPSTLAPSPQPPTLARSPQPPTLAPLPQPPTLARSPQPPKPALSPSASPSQPVTGPQFFQSPAANAPKSTTIKPKSLMKSVEQQQKDRRRENIVRELKEYKTKIDKELENGKEYDLFFLGVPKRWKQSAVEKVLVHLRTNYSLENLELDVQDIKAVEDGTLNEIVSKIDGYDVAIQNGKNPHNSFF